MASRSLEARHGQPVTSKAHPEPLREGWRQFLALATAFERGEATDDQLSDGFEHLVRCHGDRAASKVRQAIVDNTLSSGVAVTILYNTGRKHEPESRAALLKLLLASLQHADPSVRDAAVAGLLNLRAIEAIDALRRMHRVEQDTVVEAALVQAIESLS
jgi:hypothetical protein